MRQFGLAMFDDVTMRKGMKLLRQNRLLLLFLVFLLAVRLFVVDWYGVPSGSMYPTLLIGDRVVSNRMAYDVRLPFADTVLLHIDDPRRGDIVTFISPDDGLHLVKRVVALPGDVVSMRNNILEINGIRAAYGKPDPEVADHHVPDYEGKQEVIEESILGQERAILLMPGRKAFRDFGPVTIPAGQYVVLGDNRDNSKDSRYLGFIRRGLLTGRVTRIAFSFDPDRAYRPRWERFGAAPE